MYESSNIHYRLRGIVNGAEEEINDEIKQNEGKKPESVVENDVDECSTSAVQHESSFDMMPTASVAKEPPCRYHPTLEDFKAFKRREDARKMAYLEQNLDKFCITCGANEAAINEYLNEGKKQEGTVYVVSKRDCKICDSTQGIPCDIHKHKQYHEVNCLSRRGNRPFCDICGAFDFEPCDEGKHEHWDKSSCVQRNRGNECVDKFTDPTRCDKWEQISEKRKI